MSKSFKFVSPVVILLSLAFYICTGIFVVQPIGALPKGATLLYWRIGLDAPFISSPDGILLETGAPVSLLGRAVVLAGMVNVLNERKIISLPYSETMYLISTDGLEFER